MTLFEDQKKLPFVPLNRRRADSIVLTADWIKPRAGHNRETGFHAQQQACVSLINDLFCERYKTMHRFDFSGDTTAAISSAWGRLLKTPVVRGNGSWVHDIEGRSYLDFTSGIGVTATGHCHPAVVQAVQQQASELLFGQMNCMLPDKTVEYSRALRDVTPEPIETFFFSNSGSEAIEGAVKLAKVATGRPNVIAFQGGFHGRTAMAMVTSSKGIYREGYQPLPSGVFFSSFPNAVGDQRESEVAIENSLADLERLLKTQSMPSETAAMLIEPVLGEGGYLPVPPGFLRGLREICDRTGILLIVDEIQSGFARSGSMWAHEPSGIQPDLVMARALPVVCRCQR